MKILNINSYYFGSSVHPQLQKALWDVDINAMTYVPLPLGYIPVNAYKHDNEDISIDISNCYNIKDRYIFHVKHNKIFNDIRKRYNFLEFNCLHAHSLFSNGYIALQIKNKFGIPYIVAVRNTDLNTFFRYMIHLRRLGVRILKESEKIVFISESYRNQLVERYIPDKLKAEILAKSKIIPNGIDDYWIFNKGYPKILNKNIVRLLYVGAINKNKNLMTTVEAIKILQKKGIKIHFTIVGKIDDRSIYNKMVKLPYIHYIPPKPKEELIKIYRANDLFIMPSITETFGLVYAEAMSQGLPVIFSRGQGFDRQFEEGLIGYAVDCFNPVLIADRIIDVMKNFEKQSQNSIKLSNKFKWSSIVEVYKNIYSNASISFLKN